MRPLDGALWLVARNFAVFTADHPGTVACTGLHSKQECDGSRGKHPCVPFTRTHTRDASQVRRWFESQLRNVAVPVGACRGPADERLVVIDSDRHRAIEDVAEKFGQRHTPTMRVTTSKGTHDLYWAPADAKIGNGLGQLRGQFDGDVRGGNAYVISIGSVHATGVVYELDDDRPPVALPPWLLNALTARVAPLPPHPRVAATKADGGSVVGLIRFVLDSPAGERNNRLYWAACRAFERAAAPAPSVASALRDAALHIGLGETEARQTITSAYRSRNAR